MKSEIGEGEGREKLEEEEVKWWE